MGRSSILRSLALLILLALSFSLFSCSDGRREYCELGIILPSEFKSADTGENFDLAYSNGRLFVGILRISYDAAASAAIPTTMTPLKLAEFYLRESEKGEIASDVLQHGDVPYYTYTMGEGEGEYFYMPTFYSTPYAYFIITFITPAVIGEASTEEILSYVSTVYLIL